MTLRIIKPPKPGKMFVTLASTGYLFFSSRAVAEASEEGFYKIEGLKTK